MRPRKTLSCLFALLLGASGGLRAQQALDDLASQPTGAIRFNSVTPKSRYELAHRTYDPQATIIEGTLSFPDEAKGPYAAMVIAHGSAGIQQKDRERWVPFFARMGIATLLVDSFGPRRIARTDEDQGQLDQSANDADALAALRLLATDPRIDARRIGIIGFSRGGIAALETALEPFRQGVLGADGPRFAAHIAFYPGCGLRYWRTPSPLTGAPVMLALAEKDDYVPARACIAFGEAMRAAGQDVEIHVYPGAYHDFDNTVAYYKRHARTETSRACADREIDPVSWEYRFLQSGQRFKDYKAYAAVLGNCVTRGDVTTGNDFGAARQAEDDVRAFLKRVLAL